MCLIRSPFYVILGCISHTQLLALRAPAFLAFSSSAWAASTQNHLIYNTISLQRQVF